ncbi:Odorant receptor 15 [Ephemera danica]|nr:Odorant receptor 15 [Ephemera danica]
MGGYRFTRNDVALKFRLVLSLNFIFGHIYPCKLGGIKRVIARIYIIFINFFLFVMTLLTINNLINAFSSFLVALYIFVALIGISHAAFRSAYIIIKRKNIRMIIYQFRRLVNEETFKKSQNKAIQKAFKRSYRTLFIDTIIYCLCLILHLILWIVKNIDTDEDETGLSLREVVIKYNPVSYLSGINTKRLYCILYFITFFISIGKVVTTDLLFHSWYALIIEEMDLLMEGLKVLIRQSEPRVAQRNLNQWLLFHHQFMRVMQKVTTLTSPCIVVTIIVDILFVCILVYIVVKGIVGAFGMTVLLGFAFVSLIQAFLYCRIGQEIRNRIIKLQTVAYSAPWLGSPHNTQHAALMICGAATERAMPLPGAPFFALSLEFFASTLGAIFTYFLVLLQLN